MIKTEEDIREIKKEIIESRGLIIKTNNLINSLNSDIKSIAKREAEYRKRFYINSATAYIIFVVLCFLGLNIAYQAKIKAIQTQRTSVLRSEKSLRIELDRLKQENEERRQAAIRAKEFYELLEKEAPSRIIQEYERISKLKLSEVEHMFFKNTIERLKNELSITSYQKALKEMKNRHFQQALKSIKEAIRLKPNGVHIPEARITQAMILVELKKKREAISILTKLVNMKLDKDTKPRVYHKLGEIYEDIGELAQAKKAYESLIREFSRSPYFPSARRRLRTIIAKIRQNSL